MNKRLTRLNKLQYAKYIIVVALITISFSHSACSVEYEYQWGQVGEIDVDLYGPEDGTYVPINFPKYLFAVASDLDCYRWREVGTSQWTEWYTYYDAVQLGNTSSDYYMWWTADMGIYTDMYGTQANWTAPDYSSGNNVRDVTVTAHANDYNRGSDTFGYNDTGREDWITLKVWQVAVTANQSNSISTYNDCYGYQGPPDIYPTWKAKRTLGWIYHNTPTGAEGYFGKTELQGTVPTGVPTVSGFDWKSEVMGVYRHKTTSSDPDWVWPYDVRYVNWEPDSPESSFSDEDCRHPNGGTNVHEIFMLDGPGLRTYANNDYAIASGWCRIDFDFVFRSYVKIGGYRVSNFEPWGVEFDLVESGGVWTVDGGHTP